MSDGVLCISASQLSAYYHGKANSAWFCSQELLLHSFIRMVNAGAHFVSRDRAESDPAFVQFIASCVIANGPRILCLERSAKSERAELKGRWTALFGGHVDEGDANLSKLQLPTHSKWEAIVSAVKRELHEELGIHVNGDPLQFAGLAIDPTNTVGRLHIGVVFYYQVTRRSLRLTHDLDLAEFNVSGKSTTVRFLSPQDLHRLQSHFDPWTTLFLRSEFALNRPWDTASDFESPPLLHAMRA